MRQIRNNKLATGASVNGWLSFYVALLISKIFMLVMWCFITACIHLINTTKYIWLGCTFKVLIQSRVTISYFQAFYS